MANTNILGIHGYNQSASAVNKVFVAYENDVVDLDAGTGYGLNLDASSNVEFETFLDRTFIQNYSITPLTGNGTTWTNKYVERTPRAKYQKRLKSRLYLGYCQFTGPQIPQDTDGNNLTFPSRVFHSDFFQGNTLTWGLEWGQNGKTTAGTKIFELGGTDLVQDFKARKIKVGDPLFITSGNQDLVDHGPYFVASIPSPYRLILTEEIDTTATSLHFWVGSNWFDVETDDNDYITWLDENDDLLLIFKRFSMFRRSSNVLQKVKAAPGTTQGRSVVNIGDLTFYFHGSDSNTRKTGFYAYNGSRSTFVSRAIQPYIDGIATGSYDNVIGWAEGTRYRGYLGTLTNAAKDISMSNAVASLDTLGTQWSVEPIADQVVARGKFIENNIEKWFIGTADSQVHQVASGNGYNGTDMPWSVEIGERYPNSSAIMSRYTRLQLDSKNASGVEVALKLLGTPEDDDDQWMWLGEIQHNHQELTIPPKHNYAKGFDLRFHEESSGDNTLLIESAKMFYIPESTRVINK